MYYKDAFYEISRYAIKTNLVNQYFHEHYDLLKESQKIASELQFGNDDNRILINKEYSNELLEMVKVYRAHPNHRDIDNVLDYLEKDLIKYENQPKSVIAKDFK